MPDRASSPRHVLSRATSRWPTSTCPVRTSSPPAPPAGWARAKPREAATPPATAGRHQRSAQGSGPAIQARAEIRHMVEVLIEDIGYEELDKPVVKPLEGIKVAGYVGCQTNRPFGIAGESFENPHVPRQADRDRGRRADGQVRRKGDLLRRLARVLRAGKSAEADQEHRRVGLRPRRRHDRAPPASCARRTSRSTSPRSTRSTAPSSTCRWSITASC